MTDERFTLEEIEASWLGHGKSIPIGEMMAWLIKNLDELQHKINETAYKCRTPFECEFTADEVLNRLADWYLEGAERIDEQAMEILRLSESLDVHKKMLADCQDNAVEVQRTMTNQIEQLKGYLLDAVSALESMPRTAEEWHKYARWAEGLMAQVVERIKRELSI